MSGGEQAFYGSQQGGLKVPKASSGLCPWLPGGLSPWGGTPGGGRGGVSPFRHLEQSTADLGAYTQGGHASQRPGAWGSKVQGQTGVRGGPSSRFLDGHHGGGTEGSLLCARGMGGPGDLLAVSLRDEGDQGLPAASSWDGGGPGAPCCFLMVWGDQGVSWLCLHEMGRTRGSLLFPHEMGGPGTPCCFLTGWGDQGVPCCFLMGRGD